MLHLPFFPNGGIADVTFFTSLHYFSALSGTRGQLCPIIIISEFICFETHMVHYYIFFLFIYYRHKFWYFKIDHLNVVIYYYVVKDILKL